MARGGVWFSEDRIFFVFALVPEIGGGIKELFLCCDFFFGFSSLPALALYFLGGKLVYRPFEFIQVHFPSAEEALSLSFQGFHGFSEGREGIATVGAFDWRCGHF